MAGGLGEAPPRLAIGTLAAMVLSAACDASTAAPGTDGAAADVAGPSCASVACEADADCATGVCRALLLTQLGDNGEIDGVPDGRVPLARFAGGVCLGMPAAPPCDPGTACATCATCASVYVGPADRASIAEHAPLCLPRCDPSRGPRGGCRDTQACEPLLRICVDACASDLECRIAGVMEGGVAALVRDGTSSAVCRRDTGLCERPASAAVRAGTPCRFDSECGPAGTCVSRAGPVLVSYEVLARSHGLDLSTGRCTVVGCDLPGRACAAGDTCTPAAAGHAVGPICTP